MIGDGFQALGWHQRKLTADAAEILFLARSNVADHVARALTVARPDVLDDIIKHAAGEHEFITPHCMVAAIAQMTDEAARPLDVMQGLILRNNTRASWRNEGTLWRKASDLVCFHIQCQAKNDEEKFLTAMKDLKALFPRSIKSRKDVLWKSRQLGGHIGCVIAGALKAAKELKERDQTRKDCLKDGVGGVINIACSAGGPIGAVVGACITTGTNLAFDLAWHGHDMSEAVNVLRSEIAVALTKSHDHVKDSELEIDIAQLLYFLDFSIKANGFA